MKSVEELLGEVLRIDPVVITDKTGPADIESWDSFNGLILVTELEKNFNVKFTIEEVTSVKTVGDIKNVLRKYGIKV